MWQYVDCSWMSMWYVDYVKIPVPHRIIYDLYYSERMSMAQPLRRTRKSNDNFFNRKYAWKLKGYKWLFPILYESIDKKKIII